jgi:ABC-2 type transport system ATP-binding protein
MLEIKNLSFSYLNGRKDIIKELSFKVDQGQVVTLCGGNGHGKTTLLKILSGLFHQYHGEVFLNGVSSRKKEYLLEIGLALAENRGLWPELSGEENLNLIQHFSQSSSKLDLGHWKSLQSFEEALNTPFAQCSSGMKSLLILASSALHSPKLLLWDEPFKNLSAFNREFILKNWSELTHAKSLIYSTHSKDILSESSIELGGDE